jgi:hypothetical protein
MKEKFLAKRFLSQAAPTVACDDESLAEGFQWAVERALGWVQTGTAPGVLPSYWAGYPSRPMFHLRDAAHQAIGAHLLGLDAENFAMLRHFARSATRQRGWYPLWSFHFDGTAANLDFRDDDYFVREIPAVFELTQCGIDLYQWTGDRRWLTDPDLWGYYKRSLSSFVTLHDRDCDGIPEASGLGDIFAGIATYNEQHPDRPLLTAADGVACQYAALQRFGTALDGRGLPGGDGARAEARRIQEEFSRRWWSEEAGVFAHGFGTDGAPAFDYGAESSWFTATKSLVDAGPRMGRFLDFLEANLDRTPPPNIEAATYLPEVFWRYGRDDVAYRWLRYVLASRDEYPEVSFTAVQHVAAGLLGLAPRAGDGLARTAPHLPGSLSWIEADGIALGNWRVRIRQDGQHQTTMRVTSGPGELRWIAAVLGEHECLSVDGKQVPASPQIIDGRLHAVAEVEVPVGAARTVAAT